MTNDEYTQIHSHLLDSIGYDADYLLDIEVMWIYESSFCGGKFDAWLAEAALGWCLICSEDDWTIESVAYGLE